MDNIIQESNQIIVTGSPHVRCRRTTRRVMWTVSAALIPALIEAVILFGWNAAAVIATTIAGTLATEYACDRFMLKRRSTLTDGSAFLTGLLLGMSLPATLPLPMAFAGGLFGIGIGKMAFGGLGQNIFNPAMVGRVFLLISFPAAMTTWPVPFGYDGQTGATILSAIAESGFDAGSIDVAQLALGNRGGSVGEVGTIALLAGAGYLMIRGIIRLYIPTAIIATVAIMAVICGENVVVELLSGGLLLGALFMATDYVTSPSTKTGMIIYGIMIGLLTYIIRHFGAYPEGISFAILIMNGCTPLINRWVKPKVFGERRRA